MLEFGRHLLLGLRQSEPSLNTVEERPGRTLVARRPLGMADARSRRHQVHRARLDSLDGAEAVAMVDRTGEQIGHGR